MGLSVKRPMPLGSAATLSAASAGRAVRPAVSALAVPCSSGRAGGRRGAAGAPWTLHWVANYYAPLNS